MKAKLFFEMLALMLASTTIAQNVSVSEAQKIFGDNFLGPEAIEKAFGFRPNEIPSIPFSAEELHHTSELGMTLILQIDRFPKGQLITMRKIYKILGNKRIKKTRVFYGTDRVSSQISLVKEPFFTKEAPKFGWKLVKDLPETFNQDYLQQTKSILKYLEAEVYQNKEMPEEYQEAFIEFSEKESMLENIIRNDGPDSDYTEMAQLRANNWFRETPVEVLYRCILYERQNGGKLLAYTRIWTKRLDTDGGFVFVGEYDGKSVFTNNKSISDASSDLITSISITK